MADTPYIRQEKEVEPRVYELGYLLSPLLSDEDKESLVATLKELFTKRGGEILSDGAPEFIDLAYRIPRIIDNKRAWFDQAYFGWVKVSLLPNQVASFKEELDRIVSVLRYLFITTVAENTIVSKKPLSKILRKEKSRRDDESASEEPISAEPVAEEALEASPETTEAAAKEEPSEQE
jgi:ribosomal protein S6